MPHAATCVLVGLALAGCRIGFEPRAAGDDAGAEDAFDAIDAGPTCEPFELVPPSGVVGGTLAAGTADDSGSCGGAGIAELVYAIDVPSGAGLVAATDHPATTADTIVYVRSSCEPSATEVACDTDGGIGGHAAQRVDSLPAGR